MHTSKEPWQLSETEWTVFHAAREAEHEGMTPTATTLYPKLPDVHGETVRRTRTRLARWGILDVPVVTKRKPVPKEQEMYTAFDLTAEEVHEIMRSKRAVERDRFAERGAPMTCFLPKPETLALTRIADIDDDAEPADAVRDIFRIIEECGVVI